MGETKPQVRSGTREQRQQTSGRKVRSRGGRGGHEWWLAESIGQWVSFGEGRFDSTTRFLTRSLETASVSRSKFSEPARVRSCRFRLNDQVANVVVVKGEESSDISPRTGRGEFVNMNPPSVREIDFAMTNDHGSRSLTFALRVQVRGRRIARGWSHPSPSYTRGCIHR
jgi:hypothetical protein